MHLSYFNPDPDTCYGDCCASNEDKELIQMIPEFVAVIRNYPNGNMSREIYELRKRVLDLVDD